MLIICNISEVHNVKNNTTLTRLYKTNVLVLINNKQLLVLDYNVTRPAKIGHVDIENLLNFVTSNILCCYPMIMQFSTHVKHLIGYLIQVAECQYSSPEQRYDLLCDEVQFVTTCPIFADPVIYVLSIIHHFTWRTIHESSLESIWLLAKGY